MVHLMRGVRVAFLLAGMMAAGAAEARAQAVDTTRRGEAPDSALMSPAIIEAGRKLFHGKGTCYACHGNNLQGGPVAPGLDGPHWKHIDGTFAAILGRIDHGNPGTIMVAHPGGINESQVFIVAAYVYAVSHGQARP